MKLMNRFFLFAMATALTAPAGLAQQELDFLTDLTAHQGLKEALSEHLKQRAFTHLEQRKAVVAGLTTAEKVAERRAYVRRTIEQAVGGFPERTPLNPRVVGVIERDGYKIEKIIFESQPGFYVPANLYVPTTGSGRYPGVLFPLGHEQGGKSHDTWQRMLVSLVKTGYVALTWDPVGQGERAQMYDEDFKARKLIRSTTEHTVLGVQCLLAGDNFARYTIWDGLRALDYLVSRPEVDASRIACTGNSGGGTHTAYLSALDDRIQVAAPSCYLTGWEQLLKTIGPQDAEQVLLPWVGAGLDHADFAIAFAPKPYLILSAVRDFFSIVGARATFREVREVYSALGAEDKIAMSEVDRGHGYHQPNRLAAYDWFARWLKDSRYAGDEPATVTDVLEFEELACTDSGQVATSLGGETVFSLNLKHVNSFDQKLPPVDGASGLTAFREAVRERARRLSGFEYDSAAVDAEPYGVIERQGYRIEKLLYRTEPGIPIPALLFVPDSGPRRKAAVVYVHGEGKSADAEAGGDIEWFVRQGAAVIAIDVRGLGETDRVDDRNGSDFPRYFGDFENAMTSFLIGKSLVGMRAADVLAAVDLLAGRDDIDAGRIYGVGKGKGAVPLLYAAALDDRIGRLALEDMLVSYRAVVEQRIHRDVLENVVVGALREYDLPDLVAALAPRPVRLINPADPLGKRLWPQPAQAAYRGSAGVYRAAGAAEAFEVLRRRTDAGPEEAYAGFLD